MFTILNSIKTDIRRDIKSTEREWKDNPSNDYYFAEEQKPRPFPGMEGKGIDGGSNE